MSDNENYCCESFERGHKSGWIVPKNSSPRRYYIRHISDSNSDNTFILQFCPFCGKDMLKKNSYNTYYEYV
ncbi:MAG: hypothetical protein H0X03_02995 [Nitrosopumilus sp.]|nr:hypothetical protein [Nitrosopumilus sp.]